MSRYFGRLWKPLAMIVSEGSATSGDDLRSLTADAAKVLVGLVALAAGLVFTLSLSNSNAIRWLGYMGVPIALIAALGARFPPRRLTIRGFALLTALAAVIWTGFGWLRAVILEGSRTPLWVLVSPLSTVFVTYFMALIFLGPLFAAIKKAGETRPSLWSVLGFSLLGYLVGGGTLMGLFTLTEPKGLDLAVFFIPMVTAIWGVAGALYIMAIVRRPQELTRGQVFPQTLPGQPSLDRAERSGRHILPLILGLIVFSIGLVFLPETRNIGGLVYLFVLGVVLGGPVGSFAGYLIARGWRTGYFTTGWRAGSTFGAFGALVTLLVALTDTDVPGRMLLLTPLNALVFVIGASAAGGMGASWRGRGRLRPPGA